MSRDDILLEAEMSMEKSVDYMVHEFAAVRTGKASPGLVENVDVHAYGSTMKLKQLALITTPEGLFFFFHLRGGGPGKDGGTGKRKQSWFSPPQVRKNISPAPYESGGEA